METAVRMLDRMSMGAPVTALTVTRGVESPPKALNNDPPLRSLTLDHRTAPASF